MARYVPSEDMGELRVRATRQRRDRAARISRWHGASRRGLKETFVCMDFSIRDSRADDGVTMD